MKRYRALRITAAITKLVGWIILIVGGIVCAAAFKIPPSSVMGGLSLLVTVAIAVSYLLTALIFIASGQLLEAVADIASNSAHWPHIETNTARTVEFFDQMSTNANRRQRVA